MDYAELKHSLGLGVASVMLSLMALTAIWFGSRPIAWAAFSLAVVTDSFVLWKQRVGLKETQAVSPRAIAQWQRLIIGCAATYFLSWGALAVLCWQDGVSPEAKISTVTLLAALYAIWAAVSIQVRVRDDDGD